MTIKNLKILIKRIIEEAKLNTKTVYVYHISDNANLHEPLTGVYSPKFHQDGLFTAPLSAIKRSWASWAKNKGRFGGELDQQYHNMTLYKLAMPKWVLDKANAEHRETARKSIEQNPENAWGAWGWDAETFIPKDLLQHVHIVGRKTGKTEEFFERRGEDEKHRKGQVKYSEVQTSIGSDGERKREVVKFGGEPTDLNKILKAKDEVLNFLNKQELENVIEKLEYFLSPEWIEDKIKKYERSRREGIIYFGHPDVPFYPERRIQQEKEAEQERSKDKEAAKRKLNIAKNLLER